MIPSDNPLVELHHCCLTIQIALSCGSVRNVHAASFGLWWNIRLCGGGFKAADSSSEATET